MILRRARRHWVARAITWLRWSRVLAYAAVSLAGLLSILRPPPSIANASDSGRLIELVWAGMMMISAAFCAWGAARERWVGEYIGLIPLASVAAVFGISAMSRGVGGWAGGFFLIGFFWILVSRWQEVALLRVESDRLGQRAEDPDDNGGS
jgi:hypothetical protein